MLCQSSHVAIKRPRTNNIIVVTSREDQGYQMAFTAASKQHEDAAWSRGRTLLLREFNSLLRWAAALPSPAASALNPEKTRSLIQECSLKEKKKRRTYSSQVGQLLKNTVLSTGWMVSDDVWIQDGILKQDQ